MIQSLDTGSASASDSGVFVRNISDPSPQYISPLSDLNLEESTNVLGGYDEDFIEKIPNTLECPICMLALRDPQVIDCSCGSNYCTSCFQQLMNKQGKKCCVCKNVFKGHIANKSVKRQVENLKVYCRQKQFGCAWIGELRYLQQHLHKDCHYASATSEE